MKTHKLNQIRYIQTIAELRETPRLKMFRVELRGVFPRLISPGSFASWWMINDVSKRKITQSVRDCFLRVYGKEQKPRSVRLPFPEKRFSGRGSWPKRRAKYCWPWRSFFLFFSTKKLAIVLYFNGLYLDLHNSENYNSRWKLKFEKFYI